MADWDIPFDIEVRASNTVKSQEQLQAVAAAVQKAVVDTVRDTCGFELTRLDVTISVDYPSPLFTYNGGRIK